MKKDERYHDSALRYVMRHRAETSEEKKLPEGFADRLMQQIQESGTTSHSPSRRAWLYVIPAVAAVLFLFFLLWPNPVDETPPLPPKDVAVEEKNEMPAQSFRKERKPLVAVAKVERKGQPTSKGNHLKSKSSEVKENAFRLGCAAEDASSKKKDDEESGVITPIIEHKEQEQTLENARPIPDEEENVIPADMQALADIFLAEEALQVAYELQEQTEALRAYTTRLKGEETSNPIIAF